tara:strand:- start:3340 stop:3849 length:510 start_codon:yes stop_codon:yes gene_type:complete
VTWLLAFLQARVDEVGDCWEWRGAVQRGSRAPVMRYQGSARQVRRVLATELGLPLQDRLATCKCANALCVNPRHIVTVTRQELQRRTADITQLHVNPARCRKLAQSARRNGKLTEAQVAEIRAIDGMRQRDIAALYGITQSTVSAIRRGVKWKDYSNPWLQLQLMGVNR